MKRWPDFKGYGFNLQSDRSRNGQFIGNVDDGSPAEAAGLRLGDRIIEVNGQSSANMSHPELVAEIKSNPNGDVSLLVVDHETDEYFSERGIIVTGSMPGVLIITCPDKSGHSSDGEKDFNCVCTNLYILFVFFSMCML